MDAAKSCKKGEVAPSIAIKPLLVFLAVTIVLSWPCPRAVEYIV
jgi:hypothetical protein